MRITLNLATRPYADLGPAIKHLRIGMGVLALVAILLGVGLHAIHQEAEAARARDHSLDGQIAQVTQERQSYQVLMNQPANAQVLKQAAVLNKLFDEKAFSWTLAMEDLETVLPGGVQVTNLEPARDKFGQITLRLRVLGPRDRAVELVRNLEHSRRFLLPRIIGENAEGSDRPGQRLEPVSASDRVEFELLAQYNPASPEERKAMRKPATKSESSGESTTRQPVHSLPLQGVGQGRPPYMGHSQPPPDGMAQPRNRLAGSSRAADPRSVPHGARVPARAANPQPGGPQ
jgi:type IV pilus assembly protein PilN